MEHMHVFSGFAFLRLRDFCENGPFFEIISLQIILACAAARNGAPWVDD